MALHRNRDQINDDIRTDSASADMLLTLLFFSQGGILGFGFAVTDIKGMLMQSGPITRELYVVPRKSP